MDVFRYEFLFLLFILALLTEYGFCGSCSAQRGPSAASKGPQTWVAAPNPEFARLNITDYRFLLGAEKVDRSKLPTATPRRIAIPLLPPKRLNTTSGQSSQSARAINLPRKYDTRWDYPECTSIGSIRHQYSCSSCWALASVSVMSDRHCVYNGPKIGQVFFSHLQVVACVPKGCDNGKEWDAYEYWINNGLVTGGTAYAPAAQPDGCLPYPYGISQTPTTCPTTCSTSYNKTFKQDNIKGGSYDLWWSPSVEKIQREIFYYGPVLAFFSVYEDFFCYKTGIYQYHWGKLKGYHLTKLIGWGTKGGVDYWQAVNTWGTGWGENGTFKIRRGVNMVGIEERITTVFPKEAMPKQ